MKKILLGLIVCGLGLQLGWTDETLWKTDLPAAQATAKKEGKLVLIDFTGSDWCGWCIKMQKDVFTTPAFKAYAATNLALVEIDFPSKKEQSPALKKVNAELKQKYAISGFPTYVVLNAEGKEVWKQIGYHPGGPSAFISKLEQAKKK